MAYELTQIEVTPLGEQYTQIAVIEGVYRIAGNTTFDSLLDTPSPKQPNQMLKANAAGTLLEYVDPVIQVGAGMYVNQPNIVDNPIVGVNLGDGLVIDGNDIAIDETQVVLASRQVIAGDGLTGGGNLSQDITLNAEVTGNTEVNAGLGLVQDFNTLAQNMTIDVQTPLNSGLSATADDLQVDIINTTEATTINSDDVILLETTAGEKRRITRDNLFAGIGGGTELRGSISPTSGWTPYFDGANEVQMGNNVQLVTGDVVRITGFVEDTGTNRFLVDTNVGTNCQINVNGSDNLYYLESVWSIEVNGVPVPASSPFPLGHFELVATFVGGTSQITRLGGEHNGSNNWRGNIYSFTQETSGGVVETDISMTVSQFNDPNTLNIPQPVGNNNPTMDVNNWRIRPYEPVTGDPDNENIFLGIEPNAAVAPAGYTYVVLLDDADKNTGAWVRLVGVGGVGQTTLVFDQDQIQWVGTAAEGSWAHLETGDAVISVFGRNGNVVADNGDYTAAQVTNAPNGNLIATNVQGALDELQTDVDGLVVTDQGLQTQIDNIDQVPDGGSTGQVLGKLTNADQDVGWINGGGGGGVGLPTLDVITTTPWNPTAGDGGAIDVATIGSSAVVNLPASPTAGDFVTVGFYNEATFEIIVRSPDNPVMGLNEDFTFQVDYSVLTFSYVDAVEGWKIIFAVGESEAPNAITTEIDDVYAAGTDTFAIEYDVGFIQVFVNGIKLRQDEYTATTGTEVVLNTPLVVDSFVNIIGFNHLTVTYNPAPLTGGNYPPLYEVQSADVQAVADSGYLMDVRITGLTVTLPQTPNVGDWVSVGDYAGSCSVLLPIVITSGDSDKLIHGSAEDLVLVNKNVMVTLSYVEVNDVVGWKIVEGIGVTGADELPYEEVIIVPYREGDAVNGLVNLPSGYKWADFERVEFITGNGISWNASGIVVLTKEMIATTPEWQVLQTSYDIDYTRIDAGSNSSHDGDIETQCFITEVGGSYGIAQIKGYTKYKPVLNRGMTTLWEGDATTGTLDLAEPITDFDTIIITGNASNVYDSHSYAIETIRPNIGTANAFFGAKYASNGWRGCSFPNASQAAVTGTADADLRGIYGIKY